LLLVTLNGCKDKSTNPPPPALVYDTTSHNLSWVADTLGYDSDELNDVWGTDANNIYGVGRVALKGHLNDTSRVAIRWDGTQWVDVPDIALGQRFGLGSYATAIYGFGKNDFWIADAPRDTFVLTIGYPITHFDGQQWITYHAPPATPSDIYGFVNQVRAMWGSDPQHLWAVGDSGIVYFWNGSVWTKQTIPSEVNNFYLLDVHGLSATEVYACGLSASELKGVVLKFDGITWKVVTREFAVSGQSYPESGFSSIYAGTWQMGNKTEKRVWLVADRVYEWDKVASPDSIIWRNAFSPSRRYARMNGDGGGNIFLAGTLGALAHWNGVSWKEYPQIAIGSITRYSIYRSYVKGNDVMVVGGTISSFSNPIYLKGKLQ
jgi:hypothetical protein